MDGRGYWVGEWACVKDGRGYWVGEWACVVYDFFVSKQVDGDT